MSVSLFGLVLSVMHGGLAKNVQLTLLAHHPHHHLAMPDITN